MSYDENIRRIRFLPAVLLLSLLGIAPSTLGAQEPASTTPAVAPQAPALPVPGTQAPEAQAPESQALIPNARTPAEGLLTGGQPTPEAFQEIAFQGYRMVINLRSPGEPGSWDEASMAKALGMEYFELPIAGAEDLTPDNARRLAELLSDPEHYPVMLHCGSGNRVGALLALKAFHVNGKDADTALRIGLDGGLTSLEPAVRELLGLPSLEGTTGPPPRAEPVAAEPAAAGPGSSRR